MPKSFFDSIKKRIILSTGLFCTGFLVAGVYIGTSIQAGTSHLSQLIEMHQVGVLREQLLFDVKTVQADIKARNTRFFKGVEATIQDVLRMEEASERCVGCHHSEPVRTQLRALVAEVREYEASISRVLTLRANAERLATEENAAYEEGARLLDTMYDLIARANGTLQRRTAGTLDAVRHSNAVLFFLVGVGPVLALFLGWQYLREYGRPVGVLMEATRKLKAGDLNHRVQGLDHEFREVGDSFNAMADALQEQMARMQRAEELAICGKVAAGLAHEIKNPLAGVQISLQVLGEDLDLTPEDRGVFNSAREEIVRIDSLVKGLLDFARPGRPELAPVDVNEVVERAVALTTQRVPTAAGNGRKVQVSPDLEPDLPQTVADPKQLLQVLLNLMLNGVEAMPDGGQLQVATRCTLEDVEIRIADTGPGIDPEVAERIFEPFFTRKPRGTGLGLPISKSLIEQLGGTIHVANAAEGGAVFTVVVPRRDPIEEGTA